MNLGSWKIDDLVTFTAATHTASTGAVTDADAVPAYRVYEDETGTAILTGNMAKLDDAGTTGFYSEQITLSAANGFEKGKSYTILITAAVGGVTGATLRTLQVEAEVDANSVSNIGAGVITAAAIAADAITAAKIADGAIDANTFAAGAITAAAVATGAIDADALAADAVTEIAAGISIPSAATIADAVWDEPTTGHVTAGTFGEQVKTDIDDILTDTGTTLQAEVDGIQTVTNAVKVVTDAIGATGTGLSAIPWNPAWDAEVESEANDALVAQNLDHLVKIAVDTDFPTTVHLNSVIGHLADDGTAATFDRTTDSLEVLSIGGGGGLDAAGVRAAVGLASANLDTQLAAIDDAIDTEVAAIKAKTDQLTFGTANRVDAQVYGVQANALTAAALAADAVTEIQAGLSTLDAAGVRTAVGLASANLDTQLDALPTNAELATALASADDAVLAAIAALNNLSEANVRTALGLASANLDTQLGDLPTNAELAAALAAADDAILAAVAALHNLSPAQVNAEVVDALTVDVIADSTPAEGSRPTMAQGVLLLTRLMMEKVVSGTTVTVRKENGTDPALTLTLDDATNPTSITRAT
jgi:hypothetical protein